MYKLSLPGVFPYRRSHSILRRSIVPAPPVVIPLAGLLALAMLLTRPAGVLAQADTPPVEPVLEPVEVTVPPQSDRTKSTTIITEQEMRGQHAQNMTDYIFSMIPGVNTARMSRLGWGNPAGGFFIRGLNREQVAVFVDGIPTQVNNHFHPLSDQYTPDMIERLEITRGPSGVEHGASTMGGVVEIFTKKPERGYHGYALGRTGEFSTSELQARSAWGGERAGVQVSLTRRETSTHRPALTRFDATTVNFYSSYEISRRWETSVRAGHTEADVAIGPGELNQDPQTTVNWSLDRQTQTSSTLLDLYWSKAGIGRDGGPASRDEREYGLRTKHQWQPGPDASYTVGFDAVEYTDQRLVGADKVWNAENFGSPWVSGRWTMRPVILEGGLRWTESSQFGTDLSPELGTIYHWDRTLALRARAGKSFRVPRVNDVQQIGSATLPNADLDPAEAWNVEVGANKTWARTLLARRVVWDVVFWYMDGDNLLRRVTRPGGAPRIRNTGEFQHRGIETILQLGFTPHLVVKLGATLQHIEESIDLVPESAVDFGITYRPDPWRFDLTSRWFQDAGNPPGQGGGHLDDAYVADVHVGYVLRDLAGFVRGPVELFVEADNVTDADYTTFGRAFPQVPRAYYAGLRQDF